MQPVPSAPPPSHSPSREGGTRSPLQEATERVSSCLRPHSRAGTQLQGHGFPAWTLAWTSRDGLPSRPLSGWPPWPSWGLSLCPGPPGLGGPHPLPRLPQSRAAVSGLFLRSPVSRAWLTGLGRSGSWRPRSPAKANGVQLHAVGGGAVWGSLIDGPSTPPTGAGARSGSCFLRLTKLET